MWPIGKKLRVVQRGYTVRRISPCISGRTNIQKAQAEIGVLEQRNVGRERIFVHPNLMKLLTTDSNEFGSYGN